MRQAVAPTGPLADGERAAPAVSCRVAAMHQVGTPMVPSTCLLSRPRQSWAHEDQLCSPPARQVQRAARCGQVLNMKGLYRKLKTIAFAEKHRWLKKSAIYLKKFIAASEVGAKLKPFCISRQAGAGGGCSRKPRSQLACYGQG